MKRPEMDPDLRGAHPEIGIRIYVPADPEFGVSLILLVLLVTVSVFSGLQKISRSKRIK